MTAFGPPPRLAFSKFSDINSGICKPARSEPAPEIGVSPREVPALRSHPRPGQVDGEEPQVRPEFSDVAQRFAVRRPEVEQRGLRREAGDEARPRVQPRKTPQVRPVHGAPVTVKSQMDGMES